jgi:hypothetical protein
MLKVKAGHKIAGQLQAAAYSLGNTNTVTLGPDDSDTTIFICQHHFTDAT